MVREFKLVNEKGQEYSLMDIKNYCLLTEPSGLGYSYSTEYEKVGNTFIESLRQLEQGQFNGTINTLHYDNFKALVDFIESAESLRLAYKIPYRSGAKEFFKDVQIQSLEKTEKQTTGVISEPVVFNCCSSWYQEETVVFNIEPSSQEELVWNFRWDSIWALNRVKSIDYTNDSHENAPILVEIDGEVINPRIMLYVEGSLYQELNFKVKIEEFEKFLYGTEDAKFYIKKQNVDGTEEDLLNFNVISEEDFKTKDLCIRIPRNKSCELKIDADNIIRSAKITIKPSYKTV